MKITAMGIKATDKSAEEVWLFAPKKAGSLNVSVFMDDALYPSTLRKRLHRKNCGFPPLVFAQNMLA
jgi:hypothetical protein